MLINITEKEYYNYFSKDPHPYLSREFINHTKHKVDKIVRLVEGDKDVFIGLVAGVKDNILLSPYSAPFGGFHYKNDAVFYDQVYDFLLKFKKYLLVQGIEEANITLSPNIYNPCINSKLVNAMIRLNYDMSVPDIVNCIDLRHFKGEFTKSEVRQNCNKAIRNGLSFSVATDDESKNIAYDIISSNRKGQKRDIHMSFQDLLDVNSVIPVDFFLVKNMRKDNIGAGVFYRGHEKIVQGIFVGDLLSSRKLGAMDFLFLNVFNYYKKEGFDFIDLGKSSSSGMPNVGLIRFKEIHNCISTLGYTFTFRNGESEILKQ